MMNDNSYFNQSSPVVPAGYAPVSTPAASEQSHSKKPLIIAAIILIPLIIIGVAVAIIIAGKNDNLGQGADAEQIEYDIGDADTGGEATETPINQSLDFLLKYQISDNDIDLIQSNIHVALDQYYASEGYDTIIYDTTSVEFSKNKDYLSFVFVTNRKDMHFRVTLALGDDRVSAVTVTPSDPI